MNLIDEPEQVTVVVVDGWEIADNAQFATKAEYVADLDLGGCGWTVVPVLRQALANYANDDGIIERFSTPEFYTRHVNDVVKDDEERRSRKYRLKFDTFTALLIMEYLYHLTCAGLLAHRGNGDSASYRLALPVPAGAGGGRT